MKKILIFPLLIFILTCCINKSDVIISQKDGKEYSRIQIEEMISKANSYYNKNLYIAAADLYKEVYDIEKPSDSIIFRLAFSYYSENKPFESLSYFLQISETNEECINKGVLNMIIGDLFIDRNEINPAVLHYQKALLHLSKKDESSCLYKIGRAYLIGEDLVQSEKYLNEALELNPIRKEGGNYVFNTLIGEIKYLQALLYMKRTNVSEEEIEYIKNCLFFSASCGQEQAIELCQKYGIDYVKDVYIK